MIPARGWYVEVDDPATSHTFVPAIVTATRQPAVNGRPGIEVQVPRNDRWRTLVDNNPDTQVPMRVWQDGVRQPIDSLDDAREAQTPQQAVSVLVGSGARELRKRVEKEVDQQPWHEVVDDLVSNNTAYTVNADTPPTSTETNTQIADWSTTGDWNSNADIGPTDPFDVGSGSLDLLDSNPVQDSVGDRENNDGWAFQNDGDADSGDVIESGAAGDSVEYTFTLDYDIPTDAPAEWRHRSKVNNLSNDADLVDVFLDGNRIDRIDLINGVDFSVRGVDLDNGLAAGTHRIRLEVLEERDNDLSVDWLTIDDGRFGYGGDKFNNVKPDSAALVLSEVPTAQAVTGGRAEASGTVEQLELSNDQGDSFGVSGSSTDTVEGDFSSPEFGPSLTARVTLGRASTTSLGSLTLKADLEDMPLAVNRSLSGTVGELLTQAADASNSLWAFERAANGTQSVEYAQAGQRSSDDDPALSEYRTTTKTSDVVNKAIVFGRSQERSGERFTADHGTAVDLRFVEIHEQSQRVFDPDTGEVFARGPDYSIDWKDGAITTKSGGDMTDGDRYAIDYTYQARGSFDNGSATAITTREFELPALTTEMTCQQAARIIVDELEAPLVEATATAPPNEIGYNLIEEIDVSDLPGGALDFDGVEATPEQVALELGSRRPLADLISDLSSQLATVSRRT